MHLNLIKIIEELNSDFTLSFSEEVNEEANANMNAFNVSKELLEEWKAESVTEFLKAVGNLYCAKCNSQMLFYSWFDEMAAQIRVSAISKSHVKLPFRSNIELCELESLVAGIFSGNSGLFVEPKRLLVWQKQI